MRPAGMTGFGNLQPYLPAERQRGLSGAAYFAREMDAALNWQTLDWPGKLLVKGILHPQDARQALDAGADGIVLSNHGGRQLDGSVAPISLLPAVRAACGPTATILIDSGFRRGTEVVKALALGTNAVLLGRPLLYGVALAGQAGATQVLQIFSEEIDARWRNWAVAACRNWGRICCGR